jgi:hypothetical protein
MPGDPPRPTERVCPKCGGVNTFPDEEERLDYEEWVVTSGVELCHNCETEFCAKCGEEYISGHKCGHEEKVRGA